MATEYGGNTYNKYGQPSLDLVFTGPKKSLKNRVGNQQVEFTRDTIGTYIDENGIIKTAVADEARFEKDGLLIEESRTNSNYPSNDLLDSRYTVSSDYSTSNVAAPDGSNDAVYFAETVGQNSLYINPTPPSTTFTSATGSVYVKLVGSRQYFAIRQVVASNNFVRATFDLANESHTFVVGDVDTRSSYSADIENVGNGWYRCSLTVVYSSATAIGMYLNPSDSDTGGSVTNVGFGGPTNTGKADSGIILWGYQVEAGSFKTSIIPTTGSAATRAADVCTITGDNFSSWYNQDEGTYFVEVTGVAPGATYYCSAFRGSTGNKGMSVRTSSDGTVNINTLNGNNIVLTNSTLNGCKVTEGAKVAFTYGDGFFNARGSNSNVLTTLAPSQLSRMPIPGMGSLQFSYQDYTYHIKRAAYYPRRLTNDELETLTL